MSLSLNAASYHGCGRHRDKKKDRLAHCKTTTTNSAIIFRLFCILCYTKQEIRGMIIKTENSYFVSIKSETNQPASQQTNK